MNRIVTVKNLVIGDGFPKICVPIVADARQDVLEQAAKLPGGKAEIAEWRADWYMHLTREDCLSETLRALPGALGGIPLLFTVRTAQEGGNAALSPEAYARICRVAVESGAVDLIDVEVYSAQEHARKLIQYARSAGVRVVGSCHRFDGTPSVEEMVGLLRGIQDAGADICKIAVMPRCKTDVLRLIEAALLMTERYADRPVAAISMEGDGVLSRLAGEWFGSALTFGVGEKSSAPGQIGAQALHGLLQDLHSVL